MDASCHANIPTMARVAEAMIRLDPMRSMAWAKIVVAAVLAAVHRAVACSLALPV